MSCGRAHDPSANHQHIKPEEVKILYTCLYFLLCSVCGFIQTFAGSHLSQSLFGVRFLEGETPAVDQLVANLSPPSPAYPFPLCASPWHHVGGCRAFFQTIQPTVVHNNPLRSLHKQTSSASAPRSSQELSLKGGHSSLRFCICSAWESLLWAVDNLSRSDWKTLSKLTQIVFCKIISQSVIFENTLVKISILQTFAIWL